MKHTSVLQKILYCGIGLFIIFFAQLTLPRLFDVTVSKELLYIVGAVVLYFLLTDSYNSKQLARNAFFLIVLFGTVIALIRPVQYALDEESHLQNAIGISDSFLFKYSDEKLLDYDSVFVHDGIRNQANYKGKDYWYAVEHQDSKIAGTVKSFDNPAFLPGTIGFNLGRLFSKKIYISYYLGRIVHVIAYALLVFLAIRLSKSYKQVLYLLGVLPSGVYVVSAYHYDYLYYGASLLILAMLTNVLAEKEKITPTFIAKYQLITLLFAFSKFPFILVGTLLVSLPSRYFERARHRWLAGVAFLPVFVLSLIYTGIINLFHFHGSVTGESPGVAYFIRHPLPIIRTLIDAPVVIVDNFISRPLQYITHTSGFLLVTTVAIVFFFALLLSMTIRIQLPKIFRYYTLFLMFVIASLMIFAITGDPRVYTPGNILVGGVQGRYYYFMIGLFPLFFGDWLKEYFPLMAADEETEDKITYLLQLTLPYLLILTISIGFYTQI